MSTLWDLYHLAGNPFFQDPLGSNTAAHLPAIDQLFVGRAAELDLARTLVTHDHATRTLIVGDAGVGKTTFLNRLQEDLARERDGHGTPRYVTHTPAIRVQSTWTPIDFCAEVLRTLLLMRTLRTPHSVSSSIWRTLHGVFGRVTSATTFWDRIAQIVEGRTLMGLGVQGGATAPSGAGGQLGVTAQASWAPPVLHPPSMLLITEDACQLAVAELRGELVFVLNNLENLSRDDARHAAGLFQDVRDLFLTSRTHWIVCGTPNAETQVIRASVQVGGIFQTAVTLSSLAPAEIAELLARRYAALQQGRAAVIPPVRPKEGAMLARMYHGDLRNFLRLLQDAVLRGAGVTRRDPLRPELIIRLMGHSYVQTMRTELPPTSWRYLQQTVLGDRPDAPISTAFRQVDAAERCGVTPQAIKRHIAHWRKAQLVTFDREEGRSEWWRLTGTAAVGFAALALDQQRDITPLLGGAAKLGMNKD